MLKYVDFYVQHSILLISIILFMFMNWSYWYILLVSFYIFLPSPLKTSSLECRKACRDLLVLVYQGNLSSYFPFILPVLVTSFFCPAMCFLSFLLCSVLQPCPFKCKYMMKFHATRHTSKLWYCVLLCWDQVSHTFLEV